MDYSEDVLGTHVATKLHERARATILRIGKDAFDRADLANVSCFNFTAASNLSTILNRELQVRDTEDVFKNVTYSMLVFPRLGPVSLAVLGAAFEAKGLGGDRPLYNWVHQHLDEGKKIVTFEAVKHRHRDTESAEAKHRQSARRSKAHRLRTDRFLKRSKKVS